MKFLDDIERFSPFFRCFNKFSEGKKTHTLRFWFFNNSVKLSRYITLCLAVRKIEIKNWPRVKSILRKDRIVNFFFFCNKKIQNFTILWEKSTYTPQLSIYQLIEWYYDSRGSDCLWRVHNVV